LAPASACEAPRVRRCARSPCPCAVRSARQRNNPTTGEGRKRAMANGVKFGRTRKLSDYQRAEAMKRRAAGETLTSIAKSYGVAVSVGREGSHATHDRRTVR